MTTDADKATARKIVSVVYDREHVAEIECKAAETFIARALADAREQADQRLHDLVRHQRGALHEAGLITDAEYAALASDHGAVARLEGYDAAREQGRREGAEEMRERAAQLFADPNDPASIARSKVVRTIRALPLTPEPSNG